MKFTISKITINKRAIKHIVFWMVCTFILTLVYGVGLPNYWLGLQMISMFMPVHMLYFYTTNYWVIPKYLYRRKYVQLVLLFLICSIVCGFLFRSVEILFADPYIYKVLIAQDPSYVWKKLDGSIYEQYTKTHYIITALEQCNTIIWIATSLKFFIMWQEKKQVALQAELNFLKGQIHPHFLFNTLNNLYSLTLNQSPKSPSVVLGLSDILRYMLYECNRDDVLLTKDLEILESYISLEKIRYENRLDLSLSITGDLNGFYIAPLLMLPLVENAFKHGTSEMVQEAWINIDLQLTGNRLTFKVSNSKPVSESVNLTSHFDKIGLSNVRKRLELLYKDAYHFDIYDEEEMFVAILEVDLNKCIPHIDVQTDSNLLRKLKRSEWDASKTKTYHNLS